LGVPLSKRLYYSFFQTIITLSLFDKVGLYACIFSASSTGYRCHPSRGSRVFLLSKNMFLVAKSDLYLRKQN
jgi:hypothetical protein